MKHIILIILLTLGVWAEEVGVPFIPTEGWYSNVIFSDDGSLSIRQIGNKFTIIDARKNTEINTIDVEKIGNIYYYKLASKKKSIFYSNKNQVYEWNLIRNVKTNQFQSTRGSAYYGDLSLSSDESLLTVLDKGNNVVDLWDVDSKKLISSIALPMTSGKFLNVAISSDAKNIVLQDSNKKLFIWDNLNNKFSNFKLDNVDLFSVTNLGNKILFISNKLLKSIDTETGEIHILTGLRQNQIPKEMQLNRLGNFIFLLYDDCIECINLQNLNRCNIDGEYLKLSNNMDQVIGINFDNMISANIYDCNTTAKHKFQAKHVNITSFSNNLKYFFYSDGTDKLSIWNLSPTIEKFFETNVDLPIKRVYSSLDDQKIFILHPNEFNISIFSFEYKKLIGKLCGHHSEVMAIANGEQKNILYSIDETGIVKKWSLLTNKEIATTEVNATIFDMGIAGLDTPYRLDLSSNKKNLIVEFNRHIAFLDGQSLQILKIIKTKKRSKNSISADKKQLLIQDRSNHIVSVDTDTLVATEHTSEIDLKNLEPKITVNTEDNHINFIRTETNKKIVSIYQFSDGEWVVIKPDGYFDASSNARQYIYIRTDLLKSQKIDDASYKKYHTKIKLGENK
ncbi:MULTISPECIES: hypothetical protein [unclassified Sulfuricurvum]|uniref:hypothetical protein n=1 Tax=unclassified Sulfuricurvum TaxID=2632390 RepID=UPI00029994B3|nr:MULTISPECIES: hypothetical protein [unclassified Sulfuricurvum]AFV97420.1 hypothetical protein B649_05530 [Candidatus Sulfuricurvum sp. RIFRC-1]HBM35116.1 hypothetical protein [Sulfuricurvum sp.]